MKVDLFRIFKTWKVVKNTVNLLFGLVDEGCYEFTSLSKAAKLDIKIYKNNSSFLSDQSAL